MTQFSTWKKAWALLDRSERRLACGVLVIVVIVGLLSAGMVGSVFPFLAALADREAINTIPMLSGLYRLFDFASEDAFVFALGLGTLFTILFATAAQILRSFTISMFCARQAERIGVRLLSNYTRQPYVFFLDQHTGNLQTQILVVIRQVIDQFYRPAADICAAALSALAILALIFWFAPLVSLYSILILGGVYGTTYVLIRRRISQQARVLFTANQNRFRITNEVLGGIKALKILGKEQSYVDRFKKPSHDAARAQAITSITSEIPNYVLQSLAFGGIIILALFLANPIGENAQASLGDILPIIGLFAFAGQRLLPELQRIYAAFTQMQHGYIAVETLYHDLMETPAPADQNAQVADKLEFKHELVFQNVSFKYPNSDRLGLDDVSFQISAGERIGVVGATGSGKSTLADVLLGLILPERGEIRADRIEIDRRNLRAWQNTLGYVPQDIFLIDASIEENIALGCLPDEIDTKRVERACDIAQLTEFIKRDLPNGLDTQVGERGVRLSGGQRQRIGIARAVYNDASFLIFDEATSALDPITETDVMASITNLPGEITMVLIAHRLSTVAICDRIFVLDQGCVIAMGTWDELMEGCSVFRNLVEGHANGK